MGGISLLVTDQQEGGNLVGSNGPELVRFTNTHTGWSSEMEGYITDDNRDAPGLISDLVRIDESTGEESEPVKQFWKAGDAKRIIPTDNGEGFDPAPGSSAKGPTRNSNLGKFVVSLVEAGYDDTQLNAGVSNVDGTLAYVERVEQEPLRRGRGKSRTAQDAQTENRPYFVLLVTKLADQAPAAAPARPTARAVARPAAGKAPARSTARPVARQAPQAPPAGDADTEASALLTALVMNAGGELPKARVPAEMMKALNSDFSHLAPMKGELVKRLANAQFIAGVEGLAVSEDGKTITLG